jgi:hypothetical protein
MESSMCLNENYNTKTGFLLIPAIDLPSHSTLF